MNLLRLADGCGRDLAQPDGLDLTRPHQIGERRFSLVAMTLRDGAETLEAFCSRPLPDRVALIIGAEGAGLSPAVEAAADRRVTIPIEPGVDSLNLSVAAGIALEQLRRGTRCQGILPRPERPQT